jgi:hypothetical protein
MRANIAKPDQSEHPPFALTYVNATAAALAESNIVDIRDLMLIQCDSLEALVSHVADEKANLTYAPGKWSLKESIVHLSDTERVFGYRAMRIARGDETPLAAFDQDSYVPESRANVRTLKNILAEFRAVRGATLAMVNSFDDEALGKTGMASNKLVSVRALCWLMAGHAAHHIVITRDRYLPALA